LAIDPVAGKSSRARLAVTIAALVRVSDSCGTTATSRLRQTSAQLGTTRRTPLGAIAISAGVAVPAVIHPTTAAAISTIGAGGQRGMRASRTSNASAGKPIHGASSISLSPSTPSQPQPELQTRTYRLRDRSREPPDQAADPQHQQNRAENHTGGGDLHRLRSAGQNTADTAFIGCTGSGRP